MLLKEVVLEIEQSFQMSLAEDFDNVGLLCGNLNREITGILVCHDALEPVIEEAIDKNANLVVCFHPIIFSGLKSITGKNYVEKTILKAIENKIAIYAIHTAWDNDFNGVNYKMAEVLGLKNQNILLPKKNQLSKLEVYIPKTHTEEVKNALFKAGAGSIGFYDECSFTLSGTGNFRPLEGAKPFLGTQSQRETVAEEMLSLVFEQYKERQILKTLFEAHPYEEVAYQIIRLENQNQFAGLGRFGNLEQAMSEKDFLQFLKEKFNLKVIRHSNVMGKKIQKVAVFGGSGVSGLQAAHSLNCDAFITGDVKYHDFFRAENKMLICDIGHFESEQFVNQQIFEVLSEKFHKFAVLKSTVETNPVKYFL